MKFKDVDEAWKWHKTRTQEHVCDRLRQLDQEEAAILANRRLVELLTEHGYVPNFDTYSPAKIEVRIERENIAKLCKQLGCKLKVHWKDPVDKDTLAISLTTETYPGLVVVFSTKLKAGDRCHIREVPSTYLSLVCKSA